MAHTYMPEHKFSPPTTHFLLPTHHNHLLHLTGQPSLTGVLEIKGRGGRRERERVRVRERMNKYSDPRSLETAGSIADNKETRSALGSVVDYLNVVAVIPSIHTPKPPYNVTLLPLP